MTEEEVPVEAKEEVQGTGTEEAEELDDAAKLKEAIGVETEEVGPLRQKVTITIPRETIDERMSDQFKELKRDAIVPGFRKGRAPMKLVEKRFGTEVGDQLVSQLVGESYMAAVDKAELKTIGDPLIWVNVEEKVEGRRVTERMEKLVSVEEAMSVLELPDEGPMVLTCEVELRPEFELPDLDGIPIQKPEVSISDGDVATEIDRLRSARGQYVPVEDGKIEEDDLIVADMTLLIDGEVVKEAPNTALSARPQRIEGVVVEDMGAALVGHQAGDTVRVVAPIGDDHEKLDYRGKEATFELVILDVKRLRLPPLDGEFLGALGFESEDELREYVRASLEARLSTVIRRGMRGQVQKYLMDHVAVEVPDRMTQRQTDRLVGRRMVEMYRMGLSPEAIQKHTDALRSTARDEAVNDLKMFFIMEKIAEEQEVDVAEDEMNGAIASIAQHQNRRFDRVRDELAKGDGLAALWMQLRDDKILDALLERAVVTEIEGPKTSGKGGEKKAPAGQGKSSGKSARAKAPAKKEKKAD